MNDIDDRWKESQIEIRLMPWKAPRKAISLVSKQVKVDALFVVIYYFTSNHMRKGSYQFLLVIDYNISLVISEREKMGLQNISQ
jgi:hypothetical protein